MNKFIILLLLGILINFISCNSDEYNVVTPQNEDPTTEEPQPEDPPENDTIFFSKTDITVTQNPCGSMYCSIKQLNFLNDQIGYVISGVDIYKTTNSGETWSVILNQDIAGKVDIVNENLIFSNVYDGILKTTDGFATTSWISRPFPQMCPETNMLDVGTLQFVNEQKGFMVDDCSKNILYSTNDSGDTWNQIYNSENEISHFYFQNELEGLIIINNQIYLTQDGGENWSESSSIPDNFEYIVYQNNNFLLPGGIEIEAPIDNETMVELYDFNDNGDIVAVLHNETNTENQWQLMLYMNNEEPEWILVDQLDEANYSSVHLQDNKTIHLSKLFSGEIIKYNLE